MVGKILGVGGAGLFQLSMWGVIAAAMFHFQEELLSLVGFSSGGIDIPSLSITQLVVVLFYFIFGYFLYASLYAAVGSLCNSDQEAQQVQMPVLLLLIIPMMSMQVISNDPRGSVAEILTQIPFFSPILMPMRYLLGGASNEEVLLSLFILLLTLGLAVLIASKIYRVGILMYGKRPSLKEISRWIWS